MQIEFDNTEYVKIQLALLELYTIWKECWILIPDIEKYIHLLKYQNTNTCH